MTAPTSVTTLSEDNLRCLILYEYRLGSSDELAATRINQLMGEGLVSNSTVCRWFERFRSGNYSLEDEPQHVNEELLATLSIRSTSRNPTVDLNAIDEGLLKRIVKKFTAISGGKFYRSCRKAKEFVDGIKPLWTIPGAMLSINGEIISAWRHVTETDEFGCSQDRIIQHETPKIPYEFCRIEQVTVSYCGTAILKQFVLPVLEAVNIDRLWVARMPHEDVLMVLRTAKCRVVQFCDEDYNPNWDLFKDCKHIFILVGGGYNYTNCLFELLRERKTVIFHCKHFHTSMIIVFLKNWLMGESTGTLERLTFYLWEAYLRSQDMERVLNQSDIRDLTKSCLKTRDGYVLQGRGLGRLRIALDYNIDKIHFQFE